MDLAAEREKREARIKAKHERIKAETGAQPTPADVAREDVKDDAKKVKDSERAKIAESDKASEETAEHSVK